MSVTVEMESGSSSRITSVIESVLKDSKQCYKNEIERTFQKRKHPEIAVIHKISNSFKVPFKKVFEDFAKLRRTHRHCQCRTDDPCNRIQKLIDMRNEENPSQEPVDELTNYVLADELKKQRCFTNFMKDLPDGIVFMIADKTSLTPALIRRKFKEFIKIKFSEHSFQTGRFDKLVTLYQRSPHPSILQMIDATNEIFDYKEVFSFFEKMREINGDVCVAEDTCQKVKRYFENEGLPKCQSVSYKVCALLEAEFAKMDVAGVRLNEGQLHLLIEKYNLNRVFIQEKYARRQRIFHRKQMIPLIYRFYQHEKHPTIQDMIEIGKMCELTYVQVFEIYDQQRSNDWCQCHYPYCTCYKVRNYLLWEKERSVKIEATEETDAIAMNLMMKRVWELKDEELCTGQLHLIMEMTGFPPLFVKNYHLNVRLGIIPQPLFIPTPSNDLQEESSETLNLAADHVEEKRETFEVKEEPPWQSSDDITPPEMELKTDKFSIEEKVPEVTTSPEFTIPETILENPIKEEQVEETEVERIMVEPKLEPELTVEERESLPPENLNERQRLNKMYRKTLIGGFLKDPHPTILRMHKLSELYKVPFETVFNDLETLRENNVRSPCSSNDRCVKVRSLYLMNQVDTPSTLSVDYHSLEILSKAFQKHFIDLRGLPDGVLFMIAEETNLRPRLIRRCYEMLHNEWNLRAEGYPRSTYAFVEFFENYPHPTISQMIAIGVLNHMNYREVFQFFESLRRKRNCVCAKNDTCQRVRKYFRNEGIPKLKSIDWKTSVLLEAEFIIMDLSHSQLDLGHMHLLIDKFNLNRSYIQMKYAYHATIRNYSQLTPLIMLCYQHNNHPNIQEMIEIGELCQMSYEKVFEWFEQERELEKKQCAETCICHKVRHYFAWAEMKNGEEVRYDVKDESIDYMVQKIEDLKDNILSTGQLHLIMINTGFSPQFIENYYLHAKKNREVGGTRQFPVAKRPICQENEQAVKVPKTE